MGKLQGIATAASAKGTCHIFTVYVNLEAEALTLQIQAFARQAEQPSRIVQPPVGEREGALNGCTLDVFDGRGQWLIDPGHDF